MAELDHSLNEARAGDLGGIQFSAVGSGISPMRLGTGPTKDGVFSIF